MFFYEVSDQVMFFHGERFCPFWRITRNGISLSCFPLLVSYFLRNLRSSSPTGIGKKDTEGRFHTISVTRLHIYREGLISGRRSALRLMWISNKVVFNVRVIVLRTYARLIAKKKKILFYCITFASAFYDITFYSCQELLGNSSFPPFRYKKYRFREHLKSKDVLNSFVYVVLRRNYYLIV